MPRPSEPNLSPAALSAASATAVAVEVLPPALPHVAVDLERVGVVADGIRGEFATLLRGLPGGLRNVSELARGLEVARPVCQRLVGGIRRAGGAVDLLLALPGVEGLERVVEAARARGADEAAVARAALAVARYEELIQRHGGSQAKLNAAIQAAQNAPNPAAKRGGRDDPEQSDGQSLSESEHRRRLFEAGRALRDRWCDCKFTVLVLAPSAGDAARVDHVGAYGYIGVRSGPRGAPLCMSQRLAIGQSAQEAASAPAIRSLRTNTPMQGASTHAVLEPFCSQPLARVISRTRGADLDQFIELPPEQDGPGADVVLADRSTGGRHPRDDDPPVVNMATLADVPPRRLVVTIYLHRTLARECVASAGCYIPGVRGTVATRVGADGAPECVPPGERWFDRISHRPAVEYLSPGLEGVETPWYPRMRELCGMLFEAGGESGWDPAEFVGFRIAVEHPVWNAEYLLSLDFAGAES